MNVLFMCEANRFRSKVAELLLNRHFNNKRMKAKSAGVYLGGYRFDKKLISVCSKFGLKLEGSPKKIDKDLWHWADLIITVSDELHFELNKEDKEKGKEVIEWDVANIEHYTEEDMIRVIREINTKVKGLVSEL